MKTATGSTPTAQCNLSNDELINKVQDWVSKLAKSGGEAWTLRVPVDFNNDPDVLISELCKRFAGVQWKEASAPVSGDWIHGELDPEFRGDIEYMDPGGKTHKLTIDWNTSLYEHKIVVWREVAPSEGQAQAQAGEEPFPVVGTFEYDLVNQKETYTPNPNYPAPSAASSGEAAHSMGEQIEEWLTNIIRSNGSKTTLSHSAKYLKEYLKLLK